MKTRLIFTSLATRGVCVQLAGLLCVAGVLMAAPGSVQAADEAPASQETKQDIDENDPRIQLLEAILVNDGSKVRTLLAEGVNPNIREMDRGPAVVMAVSEKSNHALEELVASPDLMVDALNDSGETALMVASMIGNRRAVALLIEAGAALDREGWSPLHYAASNGHNEIVKMLIDAGANLDSLSPNGSTPLMMAARRGNLTPYQTLLLAGADPRPVNASNLSAADYLDRIGDAKRAELLRSYILGFKPGAVKK